MNYKADIVVIGDSDRLLKCLIPEKKGFRTARSTVNISKEKGHLKLKITAGDAVALRTGLNSMAKLLVVYEKMKNLKNGKQ